MIAAVASVHGLPLFTRNPADLVGLDAAVEVIAV
jgi:predicted nucleic acid-binding protein